jgi:N-methylhydantoinase B
MPPRSVNRAQRRGWLATSPDDVARRYQAGDLDRLDVVRHYGVILDWGTGEVQERSTVQFRDMFQRRAVAFWKDL